MRLYYFIGSLIRPFAVASLIIYSRITGRPRVRIILQNDQGQILLLQTWLSGNLWGLPGGGVERNEDPMSAAARELVEETGINLPKDALSQDGSLRASGHEEIVFMALLRGEVLNTLPNRFEVKSAQWFSVGELPPLEPLAATIVNKIAKTF